MFSLTVLDVGDQVSTDNKPSTLYFVNVYDTDLAERFFFSHTTSTGEPAMQQWSKTWSCSKGLSVEGRSL